MMTKELQRPVMPGEDALASRDHTILRLASALRVSAIDAGHAEMQADKLVRDVLEDIDNQREGEPPENLQFASSDPAAELASLRRLEAYVRKTLDVPASWPTALAVRAHAQAHRELERKLAARVPAAGGGDAGGPLPCPFCGSPAAEVGPGTYSCGTRGAKLAAGHLCPGYGGGLILPIWNLRPAAAPADDTACLALKAGAAAHAEALRIGLPAASAESLGEAVRQAILNHGKDPR